MKLSFIGSTLSYLKGRVDRAHEYFVLWCIPMTVAKPCQRLLLIMVFAGMVSLMQLKKNMDPVAPLCVQCIAQTAIQIKIVLNVLPGIA